MKIQSNIRFSETPQRWDEFHLIYYYNIVEVSEGFEADFVVVKSIEEIDEAITRAFLAPEIDQKIVDNIEIPHHGSREGKIQVFFKYLDASSMVQSYPDLMVYIRENAIPIIFEVEGVYIYLSVIYDEHRNLFNYFNAIITE
jgi:hypothetical protein